MDIPRPSSYRPFWKKPLFWVACVVQVGLLATLISVIWHFIAKYW